MKQCNLFQSLLNSRMLFINGLFVPLYLLQIPNAIFSVAPFVCLQWAWDGIEGLSAAGVDNRNTTTNGEGAYRCQTAATWSVSGTQAGARGERCSILRFSCAILGTQEEERKWREGRGFQPLEPFFSASVIMLFFAASFIQAVHLTRPPLFISLTPSCPLTGHPYVSASVRCVFLASNKLQMRFGNTLHLDLVITMCMKKVWFISLVMFKLSYQWNYELYFI